MVFIGFQGLLKSIAMPHTSVLPLNAAFCNIFFIFYFRPVISGFLVRNIYFWSLSMVPGLQFRNLLNDKNIFGIILVLLSSVLKIASEP